MLRKSLFLAAFIASLAITPAQATIGFAEWEIETPGRSFIGNTDGYANCNGTCLVSRSPNQASFNSKTQASRVEWWQYYPGYISGQSEQGFFLFNETQKSIQFFKTESELNQAIASLQLKSNAGIMTPANGWKQVWEPILERCNQGKC